MRALLVFIVSFYTLSTQAAESCEKCDMEILRRTQENMGQLTFEGVQEFLCTIDESCAANVEFYRWSNETLFDLVYNAPELFLTVLQFGDLKNQKYILEHLKSPVHDGINVEVVRIKIEKTEDKYMFKNDVLSALD